MSADRRPIRVLSVDDHPLFREGVAAPLAGQSDLTLIAEASNGREAVDQVGGPRSFQLAIKLQF